MNNKVNFGGGDLEYGNLNKLKTFSPDINTDNKKISVDKIKNKQFVESSNKN